VIASVKLRFARQMSITFTTRLQLLLKIITELQLTYFICFIIN